MTRRHWAILVLFIIPFPLGEVYVLFDKNTFSPWLGNYKYVVSHRYYVDVLCDRLIDVIYAAMFLLFVEVKRFTLLKLAAVLTFIYVAFDLVMYVINHNHANSYLFMYSMTGFIAIIVYWISGEFKRLKELQSTFRHKIEKAY